MPSSIALRLKDSPSSAFIAELFFFLELASKLGRQLSLILSKVIPLNDGSTGSRSPMHHESAPPLPFAHLNLTRNPFGELTPEETVQVALLEVEPTLVSADSPKSCVQFIGEKGRGKTTHLLSLYHGLPEAIYVHYEENSRPQVPHGHTLVLDEFQRLSWRKRNQAYRRARILILGTHVNFATEIQKAGFSLETIEVSLNLAPDRLQQISRTRIDFFRRSDGQVPFLDHETAEMLVRKYGSNLRSIFHHLYSCLQVQKAPGPIQIDSLHLE